MVYLSCFYLFVDKAKKDRKQKILTITDHGHGGSKSVTTTVSSVSTLLTSIPSTSNATMQDSTNVTQTLSHTYVQSEDMEISSIESGKFCPTLCIRNLATSCKLLFLNQVHNGHKASTGSQK